MCGPSERSFTLKVGLDSVSKPQALAVMSWSCANCACAPVRTKVMRSRPNRSKGSSKAMVSLSGVCRSGGIALAILCLVAKSRAKSGCSSHVCTAINLNCDDPRKVCTTRAQVCAFGFSSASMITPMGVSL